jgi:hypothetical protein
MYRLAVLFGVVILSFSAILPGFCQGIPGCYPQTFPSINSCVPTRPAPPLSRTVQVDVPVPCAPQACAPLQPTRPVQVRVDVVVRPEKPQPCVPQRFCCENPPIFEPFFCQGARMIQSLLALPLCIGERLMGHPVPAPLPTATPIPCWRMCAQTGPVCVQPPPASQCMPPCPPVRCAPPGVPVKARQVRIPVSAPTYPPNRPFPR